MSPHVSESIRRRLNSKPVGYWLLAVAALIALMVTVGGLTRLTGSGLSITEWHPVTGVVPPLSASVWQGEFAKYRQIPQYRFENPHMTLEDFKRIYWWEWSHRFLGRLLGAAFLLPFLFFAATGAISRRDLVPMASLLALGALQGFVGWWMVESGLEARVSVSQYRLAIHLGVAILLLGAMIWTALGYLRNGMPMQPDRSSAGRRSRLAGWSLGFVALVYLQMLLGALVAGLHAGLVYSTWPSMNGRFLPETPFFFKPWWRNFGDNAGLAQFDHRIGAYLVAGFALALWAGGRRSPVARNARLSANLVLAIVGLQVALGIATLVNQAPLALSALHQATAVALYAAAVWHAYEVGQVSYAAASA